MKLYKINNKFYKGELEEIEYIDMSNNITGLSDLNQTDLISNKIYKVKEEKSRIYEGKTYLVSDLFATDKHFKGNYVEPSEEFKAKAKELGMKECNYILGQDIIDDVKNNGNKLDIINGIAKEQYNDNWFKFLIDTKLVKLNGDRIDICELTSYRDSDGDWYDDRLGNYGYIWLRAVDSNGDPICIKFNEGSASWRWDYAANAVRIGNL